MGVCRLWIGSCKGIERYSQEIVQGTFAIQQTTSSTKTKYVVLCTISILNHGTPNVICNVVSGIHKSELVNAWCLPFLGSDRPVVLRSQRYLYENEQKRPAQMQAYIQFQ